MMKKVVKFLENILNVFLYISFAVIISVAGYYLGRIFIADQFVIPSDSMSPTLQVGDRVWVNKLIAGARIYNDIDSVNSRNLQSWRTRGMRKVARNDVVIFNFPINDNKIGFKINYVYAKRCIALPGDSISIVDGYYKNNNYAHDLGYMEAQHFLNNIPNNKLPNGIKYTMPHSYGRCPWNIRRFGPLYVPRKGDVIHLNADNVLFYSMVLEFETGKKFSVSSDGEVLADNIPMDYHIFTHNYYFTCGDNVMNSRDSRYWGFVPEEYIVGVVDFIPYSIDRGTEEIRRDRFFKFIRE